MRLLKIGSIMVSLAFATVLVMYAGCSDKSSVVATPGGTSPGGVSTLPGICGDGTLNLGEECDDGNTTAGDGCDENCMSETGGAVCGNSVLESGEQCDDGNTTAGDGCDENCMNEGGAPSEEVLAFPDVQELKALLPNEQDLVLVANKTVVSPAPTRINRRLWLKIGFESAVPAGEDPEFILEYNGNSVGELSATKSGDDTYLIKVDKPLHHNLVYTLKVEKRRTDPPEYTQYEIPIGNAGDIDGDGYSDFVAGAPFYLNYGMAYAFFGSNSIDYSLLATDAAKVKIMGSVVNSEFGSSIAIGDVNGDGYADIVVGAPQEDRGCVYVFHGSSSIVGDLTAQNDNNTRVCRANGAPTLFGQSVTLGDLNGDGFDDIIVGEPMSWRTTNTAPMYVQSGAVEVFFGGAQGVADRNVSDTELADVSYSSPKSYQHIGYSVASGDIDDDGVDDIIIGATGSDKTPAPTCVQGKVYIARGASDLGEQVSSINIDSTNNANILMGQGCISDDTDRFGASVAVAREGGRDKALIGSRSNSYQVSLDGSVEALLLSFPPDDVIVGWLGRAIGLGLPSTDQMKYKEEQQSWQTKQGPTDSMYGCSMSPAGDLNRDGTADFVLGAKWSGTSSTNHRGRVYVNFDDDSIIGEHHSEFGYSVAGGRIR